MSSNKIDLRDINKNKEQKKSFSSKKVSRFRKKSAGPGRDAEGKFTSGSGGLFQKKKFPWKRALPVVAVVAMAGGYLVWQSLATSKLPETPSYQYSIYGPTCTDALTVVTTQRSDQVPKFGADQMACLDFTAEAGVFRAYRAVFNRTPSAGDYKYWVQAMVGGPESKSFRGRLMIDRAIEDMLKRPEARQGKGAMRGVNNTSSPRVLTQNVYMNILGRAGSQKDIDYWVYIKAANKWNNGNLVKAIINSAEAREKYRLPLYEALKSQPTKVPKTSIKLYARDKQIWRTAVAKNRLNDNQKIVNQMRDKSKDNNNRKLAAGRIAAKSSSKISNKEVSHINKAYIATIRARLSGYKGKYYKGLMTDRYRIIKNAYNDSVAVKNQSPDLTNYQITDYFKKAKAQMGELDRHIKNANWLLGETIKSYNTAKNKYNAHQKYLAAVRACKSRGGNYTDGRCVMPQPTSGGGGSGGGGGTTTKTETVNPPREVGPSEANIRKWCNALRPTHHRVNISHGYQMINKVPYWHAGQKKCLRRTNITVTCTTRGYKPSGRTCSRGVTNPQQPQPKPLSKGICVVSGRAGKYVQYSAGNNLISTTNKRSGAKKDVKKANCSHWRGRLIHP